VAVAQAGEGLEDVASSSSSWTEAGSSFGFRAVDEAVVQARLQRLVTLTIAAGSGVVAVMAARVARIILLRWLHLARRRATTPPAHRDHNRDVPRLLETAPNGRQPRRTSPVGRWCISGVSGQGPHRRTQTTEGSTG